MESANNRKRQGESEDVGGKRARMDKRTERDRARRREETNDKKEARLARRRERDRARKALSVTAETQVEKATRLKRKSTAQQQRLAAQNPDERATGLHQMSITQQQRLATETHEDRTARLQQLSALQQQRLSTETTDERTARLQHKSVAQQQHLAAESREERAVRLDHLHQNRIAVQLSASQEAHIPLLEQKCVKDKMAKFHKDIAALSSPTCITCMETFPGLKVNSRSECVRCSRDKHTPKLYSMANNINPGQVPSELQVREQKFMTDSITNLK